jgi:AraC-like DNA-binding protein
VDYREQPPQPGTGHLIKARWSLDCGGARGQTLRHLATPDGCVELIWRSSGTSWWRREQPDAFVAGIATVPAELQLSGDGRFSGLRLWPWTWHALGGVACTSFLDDWLPLSQALPALKAADADELVEIAGNAVDEEAAEIAKNVLTATSVGDLASSTGRSHRWLQRWFERHVGVAPRAYLRLLRFQEALTGLQDSEDTLASHAADHGYADQAHMARDFRELAQTPARTARTKARGPFL